MEIQLESLNIESKNLYASQINSLTNLNNDIINIIWIYTIYDIFELQDSFNEAIPQNSLFGNHDFDFYSFDCHSLRFSLQHVTWISWKFSFDPRTRVTTLTYSPYRTHYMGRDFYISCLTTSFIYQSIDEKL